MMKPLTPEDLDSIADRLCPLHAKNLCALSFSDVPRAAMPQPPWIGASIWRFDEPQVAIGAVITHPNAASTFLYGTDQWGRCIHETTMFARKMLVPALAKAGIQRISVFAPAEDPTGERWKRMLGCCQEGTMRKWDKHGRDWNLFVMFPQTTLH